MGIGCLVERNRLVGVQAGFHGCCAFGIKRLPRMVYDTESK